MLVVLVFALLDIFDLSAAEQVTDGKIALKIDFNSQTFYTTTLDLCQVLPEVSPLSCPLKEGPHSVTVVETIPGFLPSVSMGLCGSYFS